MKISVAVPSFNYGQYIEACLESIRQQDYDNFEVLIADGGSRDVSVTVIERYCRIDPRFKLVSRRDNGQADAIMRAYACATGDVYCFLNADDLYICKDAFSTVVRVFRNYPGISLVSFRGYYVDVIGKHVKPVRLRYHPLDDIGEMKHRSGVLQPATFWTRTVSETFPLKLEFSYVFDAVFFYEAWTRFSWLEDPKPIAGYRVHGGNKSLQIVAGRVFELARFERIKFGRWSLRAGYLAMVGGLVGALGYLPYVGAPLRRALRVIVNGVAFLTMYRIPSI
jgi:glycosyltransferase involved in cell wall biosynthesis